jgi:hypothetical protein
MSVIAAAVLAVVLWIVGFLFVVRAFRDDEQEAGRCEHRANWIEHRWLSDDGTPMRRFRCQDCGAVDHGHVHADGAGWSGTTVCVAGRAARV